MITTYIKPPKKTILFNKTIPETSNAPLNLVTAQSSTFEKVIFNAQQTTLIHCPIPVTGNYSIPNTVINIGIEAFAQCKRLTSIVIPTSVKAIGCLAFHNCTGLTSISLPGSITEIGYRAFSNCTSIKSVYMHSQSLIVLMPDSDIFHNVDKTNCILYVPVGSKDIYQHAEVWREFKNIQEIN